MREGISRDDLLKRLFPKTDFGKKYDSANNIEELKFYLAQAICISACQIMFTLKFSKFGWLSWKVLKLCNRKKYNSIWERQTKVFINCVMVVADAWFSFLKDALSWKEANIIMDKAAVWAGVEYYSLLRMPKDEVARFEELFIKIRINHQDHPPKDFHEKIYRIESAYGQKLKANEGANLILNISNLKMQGFPDFVDNRRRLQKRDGSQ